VGDAIRSVGGGLGNCRQNYSPREAERLILLTFLWEVWLKEMIHPSGLARDKAVTDLGTLSDDDEPVSAVQTLGSLSGCSEEKQKVLS